MAMDPHELAEERSRVLHGLVAERLRAEPRHIAAALERVRVWRRDGSVHRVYADAWHELLSGPSERLFQMLTDPGERARALRQCSPFAGLIDPRTRWEVWRQVRDRSIA